MPTLLRSSRFLLGVGLLCVFASGCESISTKTDYDTAFNFSSFKTFSWISKSPLVSKAPEASPLAEGRIMRAVKDDLTAKGFRFVEDPTTADFVLAFTIGARQQVRVTSNPYATGYGVGYGPMYSPWGRSYYQDIDVREFTEGRLAIDVFDVKMKQPVWHGHATKSITSSDQENAEALINKAVASILATFPPGR